MNQTIVVKPGDDGLHTGIDPFSTLTIAEIPAPKAGVDVPCGGANPENGETASGLDSMVESLINGMFRGAIPGIPSAFAVTRLGPPASPSNDRHPLDRDIDPNDTRPALAIHPECKIDVTQSNVHIDFKPAAWFDFQKAVKHLPRGFGLIPSRTVDMSPARICNFVQGFAVAQDVKCTVAQNGVSLIEIKLPWTAIKKQEPSPFSLRSQREAIVSIEREIHRLKDELPGSISLRLDEETSTVDLVFSPMEVANGTLKDEFAEYIDVAAATIDFLNRLTHTPTLERDLVLDSPPLREESGRPNHSIDVSTLAVKSRPSDRLIDLGGSQKLKDQLEEVILYFKNPGHFERYGVTKLGNVLLHGPAGTGKTLSARILAGELDLPFYEVKTSDLLSAWYGESEKNVRAIFEGVETPCVIFFDEMDALGRNRDQSDSVTSRVLNEVLAQMDGLGSRKGILIVGATNKLDILDPALTRPGRFSHKVYVARPDQEGRVEICKIHHRKVASSVVDPSIMMGEIDFDQISDLTDSFVGDEIREVFARAQMTVARRRLMNPDDTTMITTELLSEEIANYLTERSKIDSERREIGFSEIAKIRSPSPKLRRIGD